MLYRLVALFIAVPFIELALLIEIGKRIGTAGTLALIILTGLSGAYLVRIQGLETLARLKENLQRGVFPAEEILDGILILISGALLITPGILTDIAGFCLLVPHVRGRIKARLRLWIGDRINTGSYRHDT